MTPLTYVLPNYPHHRNIFSSWSSDCLGVAIVGHGLLITDGCVLWLIVFVVVITVAMLVSGGGDVVTSWIKYDQIGINYE